MTRPLRLLIVEDSQKDAMLLVHELRRAGYEVTFERVDTSETMKAALDNQAWDLVIADYTMPQFRGTDALELLKKSGLDIPFIFVSGTIGEDVAVASMKAGAHDYIIKGNLKRLVPAVERELREVEVRRERERAQEETRRNLERIRALHEINLAISSTLDLRTVLNVLLEKIDLFLAYPTASTIRLLNKESGALEPVACRNLNEVVWKTDEWKSGRGPANAVFQDKALLMVGNVQTDPRIRDREFFQRYGLVSYLGVPLIAKREVLGVLGLYTKQEHEFSAEEIEFLSTLAGQAAIAIHNAQLYEETVTQAVELKRAIKVKDEFLSVMSHELRTPLNVVMGYAGMMKDGMLGEVNPQQEEALGKMIGRANEQLALVNNILYATVLEAEKINVDIHEFVLGNFLNQLKSAYDLPTRKEPIIRWECAEPLAPIKTDSAKFKLILNNLIDNALKFTKSGEVKISAQIVENIRGAEEQGSRGDAPLPPSTHAPLQSYVEFKVADTGVGIPQDHLSLIFERFHQADSSETRLFGGVGMGLYIVKQFTALLGGTVEVESEPDKGTVFTVRIPVEN